jgi:hypothetical protein
MTAEPSLSKNAFEYNKFHKKSHSHRSNDKIMENLRKGKKVEGTP